MYKLDPHLVTKFHQPVRLLNTFKPKIKARQNRVIYQYKVQACEFYQQMLPSPFDPTKVWGYGGICEGGYHESSPGPTFILPRNVRSEIEWHNNLKSSYLFPVDTTLLWANPKNIPSIKEVLPFPFGYFKAQSPIPMSIHIHGLESPPQYDGHPDAWFTANNIRGPMFISNTYFCYNTQEAASLWYHDNTRGLSRLNVYTGLLGAYLIKDYRNMIEQLKDIPLILQDKSFNEDGSLYYPEMGESQEVHPYWISEFYGDIILVNGVVWPFMNVEKSLYRFRIINGSNTRRYHIGLSNHQEMTLIATDGGFMEYPVKTDQFSLSPGERVEVILDFRDYLLGDKIILMNYAENGEKETTDTIMQFRINGLPMEDEDSYIGRLNRIKPLIQDTSGRITTINKDSGIYLDGQSSLNPVSNFERLGSTYIWDFVNISDADEVIHLHLIHFQVVHRQVLDSEAYSLAWKSINGELPLNEPTKYLDPISFVQGEPIPPEVQELGWKDTVYLPSGKVTRIILSYTSTDEKNFPFNPAEGGEYWINSAIFEHNDNEASRPQFILLGRPRS